MSAVPPAAPTLLPPSKSVARHGRLLLVPAPLDFGCKQQVALERVMPEATLLEASRLTHWICENAKSARAYLKRISGIHPLPVRLQDLNVQELPHAVHKKGDHDGAFDPQALLKPALSGHDIGLVSEAGMPAIADPGSSVVRAAHRMGLEVIALVGPVSLMLALAQSGFNGQNFAFVGYLPQESQARLKRLRELESLCSKLGQTQMFIETPYRNATLLQALIQNLAPATRLSVSYGLTLPGGRTISGTIAEWRKGHWAPDSSLPAVFAIGR